MGLSLWLSIGIVEGTENALTGLNLVASHRRSRPHPAPLTLNLGEAAKGFEAKAGTFPRKSVLKGTPSSCFVLIISCVAAYYRYTARNHGLWASAIDTWDTRLSIIPEGDRFRLNGVKRFDSLIAAADLRVFSAWQEGVQEPFFCMIPKDRLGVTSNWDKIGQEPESGIVLSDSEDAQALAQALLRLTRDSVLRYHMGHAARMVAQQHSWTDRAHSYVNLFEAIASREAQLSPIWLKSNIPALEL